MTIHNYKNELKKLNATITFYSRKTKEAKLKKAEQIEIGNKR